MRKFSKLRIAPYRKSLGFSLKRISRDKRCGIWYSNFKDDYNGCLDTLEHNFPNGVIIILHNDDYHNCSDNVYSLLGSNNTVSSIWYIDTFEVYEENQGILHHFYDPVFKHTPVNVGNDSWRGEYIVCCRGGNNKSVVLPLIEKHRQLCNLWTDYCNSSTLDEMQSSLKS